MKNDEILEDRFGISMNRIVAFTIERNLEHLLDRCPSFATPLLQFNIKGKFYYAKLLINSFHEVFEVNAKGKDPLTIFNSLERKMDIKLVNWRKDRFKETDISDEIMKSF
jgi:hypothetical protein